MNKNIIYTLLMQLKILLIKIFFKNDREGRGNVTRKGKKNNKGKKKGGLIND